MLQQQGVLCVWVMAAARHLVLDSMPDPQLIPAPAAAAAAEVCLRV
jgi:hypothetical protein